MLRAGNMRRISASARSGVDGEQRKESDNGKNRDPDSIASAHLCAFLSDDLDQSVTLINPVHDVWKQRLKPCYERSVRAIADSEPHNPGSGRFKRLAN
jgi:hypothetical protein